MDFGREAFGHIGALIIPLAVVGSTFSAANAGVFTGARVVYVSARSGHAPEILGVINARTGLISFDLTYRYAD
jgi:amino acid transporter